MGTSEYIPYSQLLLINNTTELMTPNGLFNTNDVTSFSITNNGELKRIVIGNDCFGKVRVFNLDSISELESVVIGQRSFRIGIDRQTDNVYRIVNCPKLNTIQIGDYSFVDYRTFEMNDLPSLQSIDYGTYCFSGAYRFSLIGGIEQMK